MRMSATSAQKTRQESKRLSNTGKYWRPGETWQYYYPIFWAGEEEGWQILVASVWGHSTDYDKIGLGFIPTLSELDNGKPVKPDLAYQFSKLAPAFIKGEYDAKRAEQESKDLSKSQLRQLLDGIDSDFDYDPKTSRIRKQGAIGYLRNVITTEVVMVKTKDDVPDLDEIHIATQDLSDSRLDKLNAILRDKQFALDEECEQFKNDTDIYWLEVKYAYGKSSNKMQAGKVEPKGVTAEYRLSKTAPDTFKAIRDKLSQLSKETETMEKRNSKFTKVDEDTLVSKISLYATANSGFLDSLTEEDDLKKLEYSAALIERFKIPIKSEIALEAVEKGLSKKAEVISEDPYTAEEPLEGTPSVEEIVFKEDVEKARELEEDLADTDFSDLASQQ